MRIIKTILILLLGIQTTYAQTDFLFTNSTNEVKAQWNELVAVSNAPAFPKEISAKWTMLQEMHSLTLGESQRCWKKAMPDTLQSPDAMRLFQIYDSLGLAFSFKINRPDFTSKEYHEGALTLLQNEKNILKAVRSKIALKETDPHLFHYSVVPESQYVGEGGWYSATIKVYTFGMDVSRVRVFAEGKELVLENGEAVYKFKSTCRYGESVDRDGICTKKWTGKIVLEGANVLEFPIEETYYVGRAVIRIQSASISALYRGCANEMFIDVPALRTGYKPRFEISDPEKNRLIVFPELPGRITVVPGEVDKVTIKVYNDSIFLGNETFSIRLVPSPDLRLIVGNKPMLNQLILLEDVQTKVLNLMLVADESFKVYLPKDARYDLREYNVTIIRDGKTIIEENKKSKSRAVLFEKSSIPSKIQRGDIIRITATSIIRKDFESKEEIVTPRQEVMLELKVY